jgi:hypothetical protein
VSSGSTTCLKPFLLRKSQKVILQYGEQSTRERVWPKEAVIDLDFVESPSLTSYVYQSGAGHTFKYSVIGTNDQSYKPRREFEWVIESRLRLFIGTLTVMGVRNQRPSVKKRLSRSRKYGQQ